MLINRIVKLFKSASSCRRGQGHDRGFPGLRLSGLIFPKEILGTDSTKSKLYRWCSTRQKQRQPPKRHVSEAPHQHLRMSLRVSGSHTAFWAAVSVASAGDTPGKPEQSLWLHLQVQAHKSLLGRKDSLITFSLPLLAWRGDVSLHK